MARGYPDGLRNAEVPLLAQIVSVVDVFDALTSERPYHAARPQTEAFEVLTDGGVEGWRDRALVDAFVDVIDTRPSTTNRNRSVPPTEVIRTLDLSGKRPYHLGAPSFEDQL